MARRLGRYAGRPDLIVLALPRGGVPVAYEVASCLGAPLDVFVVRKLGVPGHEELAMGALASGGILVLNDDVLRRLRIPRYVVDRVALVEQAELARRERAYGRRAAALELADRTVILVDDGLATGSTMRAAVHAVRQHGPARVVVAVPVGAASSCEELATEADEVVCPATPEPFLGVGVWYEDFAQTTDDEVRRLLATPTAVPDDQPRGVVG